MNRNDWYGTNRNRWLVYPVIRNQKAYCYALQPSTDRGDSAQFIEFILQMILNAIVGKRPLNTPYEFIL